MISGIVSELLEATIPLTVRGPGGQTQIEAMVDTGFSGFLTLPSAVIASLRLQWLCRQQGLLADGRIHPFDVHTMAIEWDDGERTIEVEAAEIDSLLGMSLLRGRELTIAVRHGGSVRIQELA